MRLLATVALLVGATGFNGTAGQLVPTAHELGAAQRDASQAVNHASGGAAPGFRSGWFAAYRKPSGETLTLTISVYANTAAARSVFRQLCRSECGSPQVTPIGSLKVGRHGTGVEAYGYCNNVIAATLADGHSKEATLAHDAGFSVGFVLSSAFGVGHCSR